MMNENRNSIWVISPGSYKRLDLKDILDGMGVCPVREYRLSDFGCYLLNPASIEVRKKLIGCEVYYRPSFLNRIKESLRAFLPLKLKHLVPDDTTLPPDTLIMPTEKKLPDLKTPALQEHFKAVHEQLRSYHPWLKQLSKLNLKKILDIRGICEGIDDNRLCLDLKGTLAEKISYVAGNILTEVDVVLEKAYVSESLFELQAYDFTGFDPDKNFRLIIFLKDKLPKACVLDEDGRAKYWVEDMTLVHYLHLLEQSINTNAKLKKALDQCAAGENRALVLAFNRQLEIEYSKTNVPQVYKNIFDTHNIAVHAQKTIVNSLNSLQLGILFKYMALSGHGEERPEVNISVMHDIKALEPIKESLPHVYSEIHKIAPETDAGKFYLLDAIRGE